MEHAVYRRNNRDSFLLVGVYVDDLVISGPNVSDINQFKLEMKQKLSMSDLGLLSYYLGIEVKQGEDGILLSQYAYARKILESAGMWNCNPCATPMEARLKLYKRVEDDVVNPTAYRSIIGSLKYLVNTRPDLAYSVGVVSRFMEAPSQAHWGAVKQILRYVKGTTDFGCRYERGAALKPFLLGYSDSDYAGDVMDRKSTTGVVYFLGNNLITWGSQKQKIVTLSSCEAEYVAAAAAACRVHLPFAVADLFTKAFGRAKALGRASFYRGGQGSDLLVAEDCDYKLVADLFTKALGRASFYRGGQGSYSVRLQTCCP